MMQLTSLKTSHVITKKIIPLQEFQVKIGYIYIYIRL
jgi:hypothetical protein